LLSDAMERSGYGKRTVRMVAVETPAFHPYAMAAPAGKRRCLFLQTQVSKCLHKLLRMSVHPRHVMLGI
jgi:hypothetical protein